jgi:hypothetical protein
VAIVARVASWSDVRAVAQQLPEVVEGSSGPTAEWRIRGKHLAWERPLRRADREALGEAAPTGDILAAFVPDLGAKEALIADEPEVYFTTPHFDGHPSVLVRLERIGVRELTELLVEAWLARAPKRLAAEHRDSLP